MLPADSQSYRLRRPFMRRTLLLVAFCALLPPITGCGDKGPQRHEVYGKVTFLKEPLDEGLIEFEPLENQGTKSGAGIKDGEYRIPKDKGLFSGRYKVTIYGGDGFSGGGDASPDTPKRKSVAGLVKDKERIPAKYNTQSTIEKEVIEGKRNEFNFDIP